MKKILLSIISICIITLSANAVNTYNRVLSSDTSSDSKISVGYDATAKMWQAGQRDTTTNVSPEYGAKIGFNIEGTANCTSGEGFIFVATFNVNTKSWNAVSDTITFPISDGAFSKIGYVELSASMIQGTSVDSLCIIFAGKTSDLTPNSSLDFQFSRYQTSSALPNEILVIPFPDVTIKMGEISPRFKLTDYFIYDDTLSFKTNNYMGDIKSELKQYINSIAQGVVMGKYLGFNVYGVGTTKVYVVVSAISPDSTNEYHANEGSINVTVIKNEQTPTDCNFQITPTVTQPTCSDKKDGSIELAISGGVKPYSFRWNNQRSTQNLYNIGEGMYMVTVIDSAGCFAYAEEYVNSIFSPYFSTYQQPSACGAEDGTITVTCDDPTATYLWSNGSTESSLTNIPAGYYTVTVSNAMGCSQEIKTELNTSYDFYLYTNYETSIFNTDCDATDGAIYTMVSGGTAPYTYKWKNLDTITSYATNLGVGEYTITVTDANNCVASNTIAIESNSLYNYYGPEISSITISEETNNMIIFWQKPETDYIDFYTLYRERNDAPGVYDTLGTVSYKDLSVFVDQNVDPKQNSWRYKLSATDFCGNESKMSYSEYKSIHLNYNMANDNTITLQWDGYEGMAFDRYSIFKITKDGKVKVAEVSPFCTRYSEKLELGTIGYVVGVEFLDTIDITNYSQLKAESGPFSLAMSNIAELENVSTKDVSLTPNANVSVKQNTIVVDNPNKSSIVVYDILGHSIAKNTSRANYVTIPMAQKGIYLVIVGNEAFKVMIE